MHDKVVLRYRAGKEWSRTVDPRTVELLEEKIEEAITEATKAIGRRNLPRVPDRRTMHLMAKAAVTVYEAVAQEEG